MAEIHIKHHDGVQQVRKANVLEVKDTDLQGISFEKVCYRHLPKEIIEASKKFQKLVVIRGTPGNADYQRKVLMLNGQSTRPFYEDPKGKGQRLAWAEEDI